jgi:hypothetical protein
MNLHKFATASLALFLAASACLVPTSHAQTTKPADSKSNEAHTVPVIDGGVGTCSAAFTVTDENAAPVYDAKIRVHVAYGFWYARKLDLEVGTNVDGKARFEGLPSRTKAGLNFTASKGDSLGTAFVDPNTTCKSELTITLHARTQ